MLEMKTTTLRVMVPQPSTLMDKANVKANINEKRERGRTISNTD